MRSSTRLAGQLGSEVKLFSYTTKSDKVVRPDESPAMDVVGVGPEPGELGVVPDVEAFGVVGRADPVILAAGSDIFDN